jgi:hypothetical protein
MSQELKASSIVRAREISPKLKKWVESYFSGQHVHPETRRKVEVCLREAGFGKGVPATRNSLAMKIAHQVLYRSTPIQSEARVAAVVDATSTCPRCGNAMVNVALANGAKGRYCSNTKCRVCAFTDSV